MYGIQIVPQLQYTGTMKLRKGTMRAEGVDPTKIAAGEYETRSGFDNVYWLPPDGKDRGYVKFTTQDWEKMVAGRVKL